MGIGGKQAAPRPKRAGRTHREHNAPGGPANPFGKRADKAALVEKMREAAKRREEEGKA